MKPGERLALAQRVRMSYNPADGAHHGTNERGPADQAGDMNGMTGFSTETDDLAAAHPREIRALIRSGGWRRPTAGLAPGYAQANLIIVPREEAPELEQFCRRNPKPCPLLEVTDPGSPHPNYLAPGADLRTDLPRYRLYRGGELAEGLTDISGRWRDDLVGFLLGCSFTFESALMAAGVPVRHLEQGGNVPMYVTEVECVPAGRFHGPLVASMRPIPANQVAEAVRITERFPAVHGAPVHAGDPAALGIRDLGAPDFGDPVTVREGEVPVFWACGVTLLEVARRAGLALMITHEPGHMLITDRLNEELTSVA
jgi:uncharacterized protein YcsI (UPF0317 family)